MTMKRLLAFVLTLFVVAPPSFAAGHREASQPGLTVRLFAEPCVSEVVLAFTVLVAPGKDYFAGNVTWQGKNYVACWAVLDEKHVLVIDEDGDAGAVPLAAFKFIPGL